MLRLITPSCHQNPAPGGIFHLHPGGHDAIFQLHPWGNDGPLPDHGIFQKRPLLHHRLRPQADAAAKLRPGPDPGPGADEGVGETGEISPQLGGGAGQEPLVRRQVMLRRAQVLPEMAATP